MNEHDNANDPIEQAEGIVNGAFHRNDYRMLYDLVERVLYTMQALKGYQSRGLTNLTSISVEGMIQNISDTLALVETPYTDIDDTEPPLEPTS